jgi:hypothetical protein
MALNLHPIAMDIHPNIRVAEMSLDDVAIVFFNEGNE